MMFIPAPGKANYTEAKGYNPICLLSFMQKMMQEVMARNIRGDSVGITTISITMCLQAREVHRNCSAPCDYIYTGRKQGSYTWAFIDIEGASDRTSRDITKAAK